MSTTKRRNSNDEQSTTDKKAAKSTEFKKEDEKSLTLPDEQAVKSQIDYFKKRPSMELFKKIVESPSVTPDIVHELLAFIKAKKNHELYLKCAVESGQFDNAFQYMTDDASPKEDDYNSNETAVTCLELICRSLQVKKVTDPTVVEKVIHILSSLWTSISKSMVGDIWYNYQIMFFDAVPPKNNSDKEQEKWFISLDETRVDHEHPSLHYDELPLPWCDLYTRLQSLWTSLSSNKDLQSLSALLDATYKKAADKFFEADTKSDKLYLMAFGLQSQ